MNDSLKTPGELATFVGNPDLSDSQRQVIWNDSLCEKLEIIIRDQLRRFARSYEKVWGFPFDPDELTQDFLLFFQRQLFHGKFTDRGGESFNAWVATVIQRCLNRIRRGLKREEEDFQRYRATVENVSQRSSDRDDFDCGPELREDMDLFLRWYDGTARKGANHIPSILWLRLRLVLEKLFTTDSVTVRDWDVTRYVPWHDAENDWRFQPSWPTIAAVWTRLDSEIDRRFEKYFAEEISRYDCIPTSVEIVELLNTFLENGGFKQISNANYWDAQVSRAVKKVESCPEALSVLHKLCQLQSR